MDGNHPPNIDPRPEKRRAKNNPYELCTVGIHTSQPRFYIAFTDCEGIQNVCPISEDYIDCQYMIENNTVPVTINDRLAAEINGIVRKVIRLNKRGIKIVLSDINYILNELDKTK